MSGDIRLHRSYLYAPASNVAILAKVFGRGADAVVLDLEDGVAPDDKDTARHALAGFLDAAESLPTRPRLLVRINRDGDGWSHEDLLVAVHGAADELSLPKVEDPAAVRALIDTLDELEVRRGLPVGRTGLHLLIESAAGVEAAGELARLARVQRFGLGAADLAADLGIAGNVHPGLLDHVRGRLVLASRAAGIGPPVAPVHLDVGDAEGLGEAARRARAFGFFGASVIHPGQIAIVNDVFTPSADELAWATRVIAAAGQPGVGGAFLLDDTLVDAPVLARAHGLLRLREVLP